MKKRKYRLLSICLAIIVSITMISPWQANDIAAFAKGDVGSETVADVNGEPEAVEEDGAAAAEAAASDETTAGDAAEDASTAQDAAGPNSSYETPAEIEAPDDINIGQQSWEANIPKNLPADPREAVRAIAKAQIGVKEVADENSVKDGAKVNKYGALLGDETISPWDAAFALFSLHYAGIIDLQAEYNPIPIDIDSGAWVKTLREEGLLTDTDVAMPSKGDLVFLKKGNGWSGVHAAIVTYVKDGKLNTVGATTDEETNEVIWKQYDPDDVIGYVSLETIAPDLFAAEENENADADQDAKADADEDTNDTDANLEEDTEANAEKDAKAEADEDANETDVNEDADEDAKAEADSEADADAPAALKLINQTIEAEMVSGPGFINKVSALGHMISGSEKNTVIKLSGMIPEGAIVKAYPVKVQVPGQFVLAAYDITIYVSVLDETGQPTDDVEEWQPEEALNVVIENDKIGEAKDSADLNVFHMDNKKTKLEEIAGVKSKDNTVGFKAESFSIYAVTEEQPAVKAHYRFWLSKYDATVANGTPYRAFSLVNGEELNAPADPTDESKGQFTGWKYKDGDGAVTFPITASVSGNTDVYFDIYAEFDGDQYATFMSLPTGTSRTVYHTAALTKESNDTYSIDLSGVPEYGAPNGYRFVGWTANRPTDSQGYGVNTAKTDYHNDSITGLDGSVTLYPVCKKVYNVSFNGNGGKVQNLPVYKVLVTNDDVWSDVLSKVNSVKRSGYSKNNGWFDGPDDSASAVTLTGDVDITADTTYYAHWTPGTTKVTVKYWKEPVDRDPTHHVPYELIDSEEITVPTDTILTLNKSSMAIGNCTLAAETVRDNIANGRAKINGGNFTADSEMYYFYTDAVTAYDSAGKYHSTTHPEYEGGLDVSVAEDGSTIIDVWYNRTVYKVRFTFRGHAYASGCYTYSRGLFHKEVDRTSQYYSIRLGESLSGIWPDLTADDLDLSVATFGYRVTSIGKLLVNPSSGQYPDAVSALFDTPLAFVTEELLDCADGSNNIDLWGRFNNINFRGGLTKATVTENYETAGGGNTSKSASYNYGKGDSSNPPVPYITYTYPGYVLDVNRTISANGGTDYVTDNHDGTVSIHYKRNGRYNGTVYNSYKASVYYNLDTYNIRLNYGGTTLASSDTIKYTQPIKAYLQGNSDTSSVFADPTEAAGVPDYMEFGGWYTDEDCNEAYKLTDTTIMPASNTILYAKFTPKKVTVNVDNNKEGEADQTVTNPELNMSGSEFGNSVRVLDYTTAKDYKAHAHTIAEFMPTYWTTPVWDNHVFKGWKISHDDGATWEELKDLNEIVDTNIKIKAEWQDMTQHSIHYIEEGKEVYLDTNKYVEGCNVIVKGTDTEIYDKESQTSRVFRYWLDEDGTTQYHPGDIIPMGNADINLTAVFEEGGSSSGGNKGTYTFLVPNGFGWDTYYEEIVYKGERLSPPPENPSDNGYTFQGWFKDEACKVKFEGFGNVNAPTDTTLYAGFRSPYRVTYYGQEDELITVQNYASDGTENLDTSGVGEHYSYSNEYAVIGWTDQKTTPGQRPTTIYNGLTETQVTGDMVMYPVLEGGYNLYLHKTEDDYWTKFYSESQNLNFTWPDPDEVTREDYTFTGKWYTDSACTNEFNWNTTLSNDTHIYAGWKINEGVELKSNYTVAWWVEKADSNGNRSDISNYYYSNSVVVEDVTVGTGIGSSTSVTANGNTGAASNVAHVEDIDPSLRTYFEYHMAKVSYSSGLEGGDVVSLSGTDTASVDKSGKTTLNIFVSRVRYTIRFNLNSKGTITYNNTNYTDRWEETAWLNMPLGNKWPLEDADGNSVPKLTMATGQIYNKWDNSAIGAKTLPVEIDKQWIDSNSNGIVTFTLNAVTSTRNPIYVEYRFRDNTETNDYLTTDYRGVSYDQYFANSDGNMNAKTIPHYTIDDRSDQVNNPDGSKTFTFYYTRKTAKIYLHDSRTPNSSVCTETMLVGESLEGKVDEEDPCSEYRGLNAPAGMEFDAWSRSSASVVSISFTNTEETMPENSIHVYAHWRIQTVVVTYVDDEDVVLRQTRKDINTRFKDFEFTPQEKQGYAFVRWVNADTGATIYNNTNITEDITVKAVYRSLTSKPVYYDLNGATVTGSGSPLDDTTLIDGKYKDNNVYILGATIPVKQLDTTKVTKPDGTVSFVYWSTKADGTGDLYYPDDVIELSDTEDTVLYAIWAPDMTTTLVYNLNYTGKPADKSVLLNDYKQLQGDQLKVNDNYNVGTEYNETSDAYEPLAYTVSGTTTTASGARPGYTLLGWDESDAEGTVPMYKDGDLIRATSYKAEDGTYLETQNLYAHWDQDIFPVEVYEIEMGVESTTATEGYSDNFGLPEGTAVPAEYNCDADESNRFDTAYLEEISKSFPDGTAYAYAKIGGAKVQAIKYVAVTDEDDDDLIIGYKWQYTTDGTNWSDFIREGTNKTLVKLYYYEETREVPIKYLNRAADGTLTEISSETWDVPTGETNTKASVGTSATSYGKTAGDTKTFAEEIAATTGSSKLHYIGAAIGTKEAAYTLESGVTLADDYFLQNSVEGVKHADSEDGLAEDDVKIKTGDFAIYAVYEEQPAYIKITNDSEAKDYTFRLTIASGAYTGDVRTDDGTASATDGHYDFAISHGTNRIVYIPYGAGLAYNVQLIKDDAVVSDLTAESVAWSTGADPASGTLVAGPLVAASATLALPEDSNKYKQVILNDVGRHTLTVTNSIDGQYADMTRTFAVTITLQKPVDAEIAQDELPTVSGQSFELAEDKMSASLIANLGHDASIVISRIPDGWRYSVAEGEHDGYTLTYKVGNGNEAATSPSASLTEDTTVALKNVFNDGSVVPSGIHDGMNRFILMLLMLLIFAAGFVWIRHRTNRIGGR